MNILVDVDGVCADTHTPWLGFYNAEFNDHLKKSDITRWEIHEIVKPECGEQIYKYLDSPDLYKRTFPIEMSLKSVQLLRNMGHEIVYVTSGFYFSKVEWLKEWGFSKGRDIVITDRKDLVCGDVLIDDYSENLITSPAFVKILFSQPWNGYTGRGWADIVQMDLFSIGLGKDEY